MVMSHFVSKRVGLFISTTNAVASTVARELVALRTGARLLAG
jgi:hypothetical protein